MCLFKRLFGPAGQREDNAYWIVVQCDRCGEIIRARVDTRNDLSINYAESEAGTTYFCRKTLIGDNLCFQPIEVELTFDANRHLVDRQIKGGQFVDENEGENNP